MISPQAFIAPGTQIGARVTIYPFAYIEDDVVIGDDCTIYPHVSLMNGTRIGSGNTIYQNAVLGASPQDFSYKGEKSTLIIGDNNVIRENVVISRASRSDVSTVIGSGNILMEGTHISHNCQVGNQNVFGYAVKIACDCTIGSRSIFSSGVTAKPRCRIGDLAFILTGSASAKTYRPSSPSRTTLPSTLGSMRVCSPRQASTSVHSVISLWLTAWSSMVRSASTTPSCRSKSRYLTAPKSSRSSPSSALPRASS